MSSSPNSALDASVLVLNKLFMAIHIISVRRAFCLLCKDLAEVVSLEDGQFATYDFATWRRSQRIPRPQLSPGRRRLGSHRQHRDPGAARDPPAGLRPAAASRR